METKQELFLRTKQVFIFLTYDRCLLNKFIKGIHYDYLTFSWIQKCVHDSKQEMVVLDCIYS